MREQAISLVGFQDVASVEAFIRQWPSAKFELAYTMSPAFLQAAAPLLSERVVSVHSCCPSEPDFPNFASMDASILRQSHAMLSRSAVTASLFGAENVILHPGYATDRLIPSEVKRRMSVLETGVFDRFVGRKEGSICRSDYTDMDEYRRRFQTMKAELGRLGEQFSKKGLRLLVENLNPRAGYMCMTVRDMLEIASVPEVYLCLDVGHLWVSHFVFGFSFPDAIDQILSTGKVVSCHLHANPSSQDGVLKDSHEDFDAYGFPCSMIVGKLRWHETNMVLETLGNPLHNVRLLDGLVSGR